MPLMVWTVILRSLAYPKILQAFFIETASVDASRRAQFLSKSLTAFSIFNVALYVVLIAQFVITGTGCCNSGREGKQLNMLLFIVKTTAFSIFCV